MKQESMRRLKLLDKEAKILYKQLKSIGVIAEFATVIDEGDLEGNDPDQDGDNVDRDEEDVEVEQAILAYRGENADDDDDDEADYF
jgi:hypothetical protein